MDRLKAQNLECVEQRLIGSEPSFDLRSFILLTGLKGGGYCERYM
jgi:hypothetical protein